MSVYGPANPRHQYEELTQQQYAQYQATYGAPPPRPPPHGVPTSPSTYYSGKTSGDSRTCMARFTGDTVTAE